MSTVLPLPTDQLTLLAKHMVSGGGTSLTADDLASAMVDVQLETQTTGASMLVVSLNDPDWVIQNDGLITVNQDGVLNTVEVNFPEGSDSWWRLAMVDATNDLTQPNLTLTFEDRIIAFLRDHFGPKAVKPGTKTRAQFVKQLVDEVQADGGIRFVCPSLNVIQPIATGASNSSVATVKSDRTNRSRGLHTDAAVTIKGQKPTGAQVALVNEALDTADSLNAGQLAAIALLEACIQENDFTNSASGDGSSKGLLQFTAPTAASLGIDPLNVKQCVTAFLTRPYSAGMGSFKGAIDYARHHPTASADQVAQAAQGSAFPTAYGQWETEARNLLNARGGLSGGKSTAEAVSDVGQLQRGTSDNPDEDSWDCISRLAQEVGWFAFSDANTLYFMDGPDLIAQQPALYLDRSRDDGRVNRISYTIDNTAYSYRSTHKVKAGTKVQRRSRIAKPQTPAQVMLQLICEVDEFRAGDVIVLRNYGPADGRWIVQDATRRCFSDTFTQFTLVPPTAPTPEPTASSSGTGKSALGASAVSSAADAAMKALAQKSRYVYSETRPMPKSLFGPAPRTMDCSGFVTLCYKAAGLPDPNGLGYNGSGYTGTLFKNCTQVTDPQPGDLCFYGNLTFLHRGLPQVPTHVTIYVGNGQVVSMGAQGDPSQGPAAAMKAATDSLLGYYRPNTGGGPSQNAAGQQFGGAAH